MKKILFGYTIISGVFGAGYFSTFSVVALQDELQEQPLYYFMKKEEIFSGCLKMGMIGAISGFLIGPLFTPLCSIHKLLGNSLPSPSEIKSHQKN